MIDFETFSFIAENLLSHRWIYAKTMPEHPHWYTLRKEWDNDADFVEVARLIREHGYQERFYRKRFTRFDVNGMKYWTMGAPLDITILINRAHIERPSPYDAIAAQYDSLFSDPESLEENEQMVAMIPTGDNVLDIGCGTGLYLDYEQPARYTGIDPSHGMIEILQSRHHGRETIVTPFEAFYGRGYDLIISIFGGVSYVSPATLCRIPKMLAAGGQYFLMFFKPGYVPKTHDMTGVQINYHTGDFEDLPGERIEFNNYIIVKGGV